MIEIVSKLSGHSDIKEEYIQQYLSNRSYSLQMVYLPYNSNIYYRFHTILFCKSVKQ